MASIAIDGDVTEDEWKGAVEYELLYEIEPSYNGPAEHKTTALVKHDSEYIYFAFKAFGNKEYIRASIRSRDGIAWSNDNVVVAIDTYGDGRYFIGFSSNPLGSIWDFKREAYGEPDSSYNVEFEGYGQLTDYGYSVELKVPYTSLIFPETNPQKWKLMFYRKLYNKGIETKYLSNKDIEGAGCRICQSEIFYSLNNVVKKQKKRLIPTITANSFSQRNAAGEMITDSPSAELSLGGYYEIGNNNLEFTLNPDFSQVEADESQVDVNSTTALRFQERRIFFNEGRDFLGSDLSTIYTRAINDPTYALKFFNRGEKHSYYFLDAEDDQTVLIVPGNQRSYSAMLGKSHANIFSYKYNLDRGQGLSFQATNRNYDEGGYGRLYSASGGFIIDDKYGTSFEVVHSDTEEPISDLISTNNQAKNYTYNLDGESFTGSAAHFALYRSTENWFTTFSHKNKSPGYRSDLGFTTENNWKRNNLSHTYRYRSTGFLRSGSASVSTGILTNFDGNILDQEFEIKFNADFSNQISVDINAETTTKARFEGYSFTDIQTQRYGIRYNPSQTFFLRFSYDTGDGIARNVSVPELGNRVNYSFRGYYQFTDNFRINFNYRYNELKNKLTSEDYFSGYISSLRGTYQFNRDSFLRVRHEYNDFNDNAFTQVLFQWQPNSATIFYLGGTINREDIDGTWETEGSQIYMKFQYLLNYD